uniref:EGF-like domain-containing protein n=2 Tax=Chromera velia CCMP2878 TaxID=1169474 RepID=A0A0G4IFG3_9ALVE|mmetsp:Transcript_34213/g.67647  ORF Transcript_34213/g.67647 Transcript_34213/m.67647 type:complete len:323 (-) Transcript_34213:847-1815(-)|eukprot:Cvel_13972.t1-p1 / transcript=Cvel_13972.t1 / gene=Cvel_13972 / organism=Chromera_velia_CCMP2878 / gene_product=Fibropellin-1, putative / transcript_product=Fibropellin-1, putative / location=Cvel_scaffold976:35946-37505(-) / protein_length=322 / sequence_SO=supercontig / SO=protein_coding / is_pseudo=false
MKFAAVVALGAVAANAAFDFDKIDFKFGDVFDSKDNGDYAVKTKDYDACGDTPCLNGGVCVDTGKGRYDFYCSCPFPWYGKKCELTVEVDRCAGDPCNNGGTCINVSGDPAGVGYVCECPWPFEGPTCDTEVVPPGPPECPEGILLPQSVNDIRNQEIRCLFFDQTFVSSASDALAECQAEDANAEIAAIDSVDIWHIAGNMILTERLRNGGDGPNGGNPRTAGLQFADYVSVGDGRQSGLAWCWDVNADSACDDDQYEWYMVAGGLWVGSEPNGDAIGNQVALQFDQQDNGYGFIDIGPNTSQQTLCQIPIPYTPYTAPVP